MSAIDLLSLLSPLQHEGSEWTPREIAQQPAIWQPAESGWSSRHIEYRDYLAIWADITHFMGVKIGEPKPVIVPPRCLREGQTICYNPGWKRIFHRVSPFVA